ncbi:hypothetical protein PF005_g20635 [Phytophthora fragariae]|uniref:RxLR effector protein n=1 Tax=Phytophthora fragariae TaxID=53985 RepID=A0A6A3HJP5_9STRA|nr:hypothetical protein PF011_g26615 [Phytophthora fragariae]KAE9068795.1 hypothetical protein PF010_g26922 [Phytophthora fragariae]KAE9082464.1 hypothetical protein PF006_g26902 [Phytophthora fragariae]KAE9175507.1 hypothetical protein PF004_g26362 [Phytophthora fragariae]KAE9178701.1 hypothetical protein PF002_g28010 [Phytophthora fragariae]
MRLSQVLVVVMASFLAASEAHSTSNHVKLSEVAKPSAPSQRFLRTHHQIVEEEDDSSEERITARQMEKLQAYAEGLGINWAKVQKNTSYLQHHENLSEYQKKLSYYIQKNKRPKSPRITNRENY